MRSGGAGAGDALNASVRAEGGAATRMMDGRSLRDERFGRLYEQLERPARAMVRRAFGNAFSDDEIEDLYSGAWLGTFRALERRHEELSDEEMRRYVLAAVANQASRELRRRGRRPTAPLEAAGSVADTSDQPDRAAARAEDARLARDVLASLPPRRRAVMMFRYGWELAPEEVCALVKGLSPRAYRKEITKGVDEVARKLSLVETGEWCETRTPLLNSLAAGTANDEERRQAVQHLAHCRPCADYLGRLGGHLHEIGSSVAVFGVLDHLSGAEPALGERVAAVLDRGRDFLTGALGRGTEAAEPLAGGIVGSGAVRGTGAAGAGVLAKLSGLGAVGKTIAACVGTGAAAATCVAVGVVPVIDGGDRDERDRPVRERLAAGEPGDSAANEPPPLPPGASLGVEGGSPSTPAPAPGATETGGPTEGADGPQPGGGSDQGEQEQQPVAEPSPQTQEFEPMGEPATPSPPAPAPAPSSASVSTGGGSSSGGGSTGGASSDLGP